MTYTDRWFCAGCLKEIRERDLLNLVANPEEDDACPHCKQAAGLLDEVQWGARVHEHHRAWVEAVRDGLIKEPTP